MRPLFRGCLTINALTTQLKLTRDCSNWTCFPGTCCLWIHSHTTWRNRTNSIYWLTVCLVNTNIDGEHAIHYKIITLDCAAVLCCGDGRHLSPTWSLGPSNGHSMLGINKRSKPTRCWCQLIGSLCEKMKLHGKWSDNKLNECVFHICSPFVCVCELSGERGRTRPNGGGQLTNGPALAPQFYGRSLITRRALVFVDHFITDSTTEAMYSNGLAPAELGHHV